MIVMKTRYREMLLLIPVILLKWIPFLLMITATVNFYLNGFAVSDGKIYIGLSNRVEIWEDNVCTAKIPLWKYASDGYVFCLEDDHIVVYSSPEKKTYDISGNLLDTQEYSDTRVFNEKEKQKNTYTDANGVTYVQKNIFGYYFIMNQQTKETVYRMPMFDYSLKIFQNLLNVVFIVLVIYIICKEWKLQIGQRSVFNYIKAKLSGRE